MAGTARDIWICPECDFVAGDRDQILADRPWCGPCWREQGVRVDFVAATLTHNVRAGRHGSEDSSGARSTSYQSPRFDLEGPTRGHSEGDTAHDPCHPRPRGATTPTPSSPAAGTGPSDPRTDSRTEPVHRETYARPPLYTPRQQALDEDRIYPDRHKPVRCRLGIHGPFQFDGVTLSDSTRTCENCGAEWEATYDGLAAGWKRVRA